MAAADFWNNQAAAQATVMELKGLNALLKPMDEAIRADEEIQTLVEMGDEDPSFIPELRQQLDRAEPMLDELELKSLLQRPARRQSRRSSRSTPATAAPTPTIGPR